jgi:uncharacterized Fe-S radical SAM superfamily protein PflX
MMRKGVRVGLIAAFLAVAAGVAWAAEQKALRVPLPVVQTQPGEKCVEPTDVMRRDHMTFILHQRDDTMHRGIRTVKHSFKNCVNCHADPATNSVLGKDGFCQSCHTYAAVKIDCFECHAASPEKAKTAAALPAEK